MFICAGPALFVRGLAELALVAAGYRVLRVHPRAGLLLMVAGGFSLVLSWSAPVLECAGYSTMAAVGPQNGDWVGAAVFIALVAYMLGPVAQAINLLLVVVAVWSLARELPDRREGPASA